MIKMRWDLGDPIITADWHLDASLPYNGIDNAEAAIEEIAEYSTEEDDWGAIIVAGDVFENNFLDSETASRFARLMKRLRDKHGTALRIFAMLGNHEMYSQDYNILSQYEVFRPDYFVPILNPTVVVDRSTDTAYFFYPYGSETEAIEPDKELEDTDGTKLFDLKTVCIMHAPVKGIRHDKREIFDSGLSQKDLRILSGTYDLIAIGHCHHYYDNVAGLGNIIIPGNPYMKDFNDLDEIKRAVRVRTSEEGNLADTWESLDLNSFTKFKDIDFNYDHTRDFNQNLDDIRGILKKYTRHTARLKVTNVTLKIKSEISEKIKDFVNTKATYKLKEETNNKKPLLSKNSDNRKELMEHIINTDDTTLKKTKLRDIGRKILGEIS